MFFCGGETFLWSDGEKSLRNLVIEAKQMGFLIVNVVSNGTFPIDLPEADLILLSLDGDRERHNIIRDVCITARDSRNVRAVSFNFHTPYPDTKELALSRDDKEECCKVISEMMDEGAPVFNLKSAFPYLIDNRFPTPCHQCLVIEDGKVSTCGRCIDVPDLCDQCGYFFVAEYTLLFRGNIKIILEMLKTYLKYI